MADFDALIKGARLPEDEVPLCLRGDLVRRYEALERDLQDAQTGDEATSIVAGAQAVQIAEEMEALRAEMLEHTHPFAFRALPKAAYRDLLADHRPRDGDNEDQLMGANLATFPAALIAACAIDPPMTEGQVAELYEVLSDGQAMRLFSCVLGLNRGDVDVPKSVLASEVLGKTAPKPKRPAPGG